MRVLELRKTQGRDHRFVGSTQVQVAQGSGGRRTTNDRRNAITLVCAATKTTRRGHNPKQRRTRRERLCYREFSMDPEGTMEGERHRRDGGDWMSCSVVGWNGTANCIGDPTRSSWCSDGLQSLVVRPHSPFRSELTFPSTTTRSRPTVRGCRRAVLIPTPVPFICSTGVHPMFRTNRCNKSHRHHRQRTTTTKIHPGLTRKRKNKRGGEGRRRRYRRVRTGFRVGTERGRCGIPVLVFVLASMRTIVLPPSRRRATPSSTTLIRTTRRRTGTWVTCAGGAGGSGEFGVWTIPRNDDRVGSLSAVPPEPPGRVGRGRAGVRYKDENTAHK